MTEEAGVTQATVFIQDECYKHRFIRSNDVSLVVERPERLRALKLGLSAAIARIEEVAIRQREPSLDTSGITPEEGLTVALEKLGLTENIKTHLVNIVKSHSTVNLLNSKAVKFVHGDVDGDTYLENLVKWARESLEKVTAGESEIPLGLSQGDLYLCPESLDAIQGGLGALCEAIDSVMDVESHKASDNSFNQRSRGCRAFVALRPPGHHCGEDTPSGFCFVNNVVVGAAHAHLSHGIKKVIVFDIDLHHGNGTQSLIWQINEETYRQSLEETATQPDHKTGLQMFYGSIHDVLSFPCEDGKPWLVQAASVSIHGAHGQHIENIHLQEYESDEDFWERLYPIYSSKLFEKAAIFAKDTPPENILVFISCGFDACEHEYPSMSRHNRRVPVGFYHRFTVDARQFADKLAAGKLISVLEGGYSDRALISGGMAHLLGLVDMRTEVDKSWWKTTNLTSLEKLLKKRRGGKVSMPGPGEQWLERALTIYQSIEDMSSPTRTQSPVPPSLSMTLRQRKPVDSESKKQSPPKPGDTLAANGHAEEYASIDDIAKVMQSLQLGKNVDPEVGTEHVSAKKLPRVILRVKDPQNTS